MEKHEILEVVKKFAGKCELELLETEELYDICLAEMQENFENIKTKYSIGDIKGVREDLHNLRGVSGSYMLNELFELTKELSGYLTSNNRQLIDNWLKDFELKIEKTTLFVREIFSEIKSSSK